MDNIQESLKTRAHKLGLHGLLEHWDTYSQAVWLPEMLKVEEKVRHQRSLARRLASAKIGPFKAMADFDWNWPKSINRALIEELFTFEFLKEPANIILLGPNGLGKTMVAQNITYQAIMNGHTALFCNASSLLNDLASQDTAAALQRRLRAYTRPSLLAIDELGYLSYNHRHADLLFEVVSRRYGNSSILLTTNKPFAQWSDVFPNASCVVTLVDRLVHKSEIVQFEGGSFRLKEAQERAARRKSKGKPRKKSVDGTAK